MFPNGLHKHQTGFLLPAALFILVAVGGLAIAINRISSQAHYALTLEALSSQTFLAAQSAGEFGLHRLMFNQTERSVVDAQCGTFPVTLNFPSGSMISCTADIECECRGACLAIGTRSVYTLRAAATCGGGEIVAERTIEVLTYFDD